MAKPRGWRAVKSLQSYTVDDAARNQGVSKGTVRRWMATGLNCLREERPFLIIGADLIDFLRSRMPPKQRCAAEEFYCFSCKEPRGPAFKTIECFERRSGRYGLRALCHHCTTVMHKAASPRTIEALRANPSIALEMATEALGKGGEPLCNDHFERT